MKILYMSAFANRSGGADVYTESLALGLAERGHDVTLLLHAASNAVRAKCRVIDAPYPPARKAPLLWRVALALEPGFWRGFLRRLDLGRPDVAIVSVPPCVAPIAHRLEPAPTIYLPHTRLYPVEVWDSLEGTPASVRRVAQWAAYRQERSSLMKAAVTVRSTESGVALTRAHYRLGNDVHLRVIPSAIPGLDTSAVPERRPIPLELVFIGRLVASKNPDLVLRAVSKVQALPWLLTIVGDGPLRGELQRLARELGIGDRVRFEGHVSDVHPFLARAHLHLFPSRLESFGLVVIEALALGVPTLALRPDGRRFLTVSDELIEHEVTGLLASDEAEFSTRLARIVADPSLLPAMGTAARESFVSRFTWAAFLDRWDGLLRDVAHTPSHRRRRR